MKGIKFPAAQSPHRQPYPSGFLDFCALLVCLPYAILATLSVATLP